MHPQLRPDTVSSWLDDILCRVRMGDIDSALYKASYILRDLDKLKPQMFLPSYDSNNRFSLASDEEYAGPPLSDIRLTVLRGTSALTQGLRDEAILTFEQARSTWLDWSLNTKSLITGAFRG